MRCCRFFYQRDGLRPVLSVKGSKNNDCWSLKSSKNSDRSSFLEAMADRTCPRCAKVFDAPYKLRRHFARKTPCDPVLYSKKGEDRDRRGSSHVCPSCNRTFASKQAKSLHIHEYCKVQDKKTNEVLDQKVQALQQQVTELLQQQKKANEPSSHTTQNFIVANQVVNNSTAITNVDNSCKVLNQIQGDVVNQQIANFIPGPMPGWPAKWPAPQVVPKPFNQGEFFTSLAPLRQASEHFTAEDAAACQQGDAKAISALLMELLRRVHADPRERNIYLSPDRGDQALVFAPHQWELNTLHEAVRSIFDQMVKELSRLPALASQHVNTIVAGAKEGFHKNPADVVQSSNGAISAHLKNMQTLLQVPGQIKAAEEVDWEAGGEPPLSFGHESYEHLTLKTTIYRMEIDAGVEKEKDVTEDRYAELACLTIYSLAWQVQQLRAPNQTAVLLTEDVALIRTYDGWKERPAAEIGEKMFRKFAEVTADFVQGDEPTPLKPLGRYIETHIEKLASEERKSLALLRRYSRQAERVCATSTNREFVKLRGLLRAAKEKSDINAVPHEQDKKGPAPSAVQPKGEEDLLALLGVI